MSKRKGIFWIRRSYILFCALVIMPGFVSGALLHSRGDTTSFCPVQFLSRYLQFSSVTGFEAPAGEFFADACREAGLHVRVFSDELDSYNFAASLYPLSYGMPNIILIGDQGAETVWAE